MSSLTRSESVIVAEDSLLAPKDPKASGAHGMSASNTSVAPSSSVKMVIGTSPPNFNHKQRVKEAAFDAEELDPDWRHQMFQELSASLAVIEQGMVSAQIECKSTTCRVELVSKVPESREERTSRLKVWFQEIKQLGFHRVDTEFSSEGTASLSYLSTRPVNAAAQLPPEFPPEVADSFRRALRENERQPITEAGGNSAPITWVQEAPSRAAQ
jgi:hypothetical protein